MPSPNVLLVEDNPADQRLVVEAFKETSPHVRLYIVDDGVKALHFLRREPPYQGMPTPDLILMDLNLPRKDGRELLTELKRHEQLRRIPVVVLTTSNAHRDVTQTYALHANCFINKPLHLDAFIATIDSISQFWLGTVKLPSDIELV